MPIPNNKWFDAMKKFGMSKHYQRMINNAYKATDKQLVEAGVPQDMIKSSKTPNKAASKISTLLIGVGAADQIYKALDNMPVVATLYGKLKDIPESIARNTWAKIPGIGKAYKEFSAKMYDGFGAVMDFLGAEGLSGFAHEQAEKFRNNHDAWWCSKENRVKAHKGLASYSTENNANTVMFTLTQFKSTLTIANYYKSGVGFENLNECITKWLTYMNFSQTLSATAVGDYFEAVKDLYAFYVTISKYYHCRRRDFYKHGDSHPFATYTTSGVIQEAGVGLRTTHANAQDLYTYLDNESKMYISTKDLDKIESFIKKRYLPQSVKEYIEYTCGNFWRYKPDSNSFVTVDHHLDYNLGDKGATITAELNRLITNVKTVMSSVTASIEGFMSKAGYKPIDIPEAILKRMRVKSGNNMPEYFECDAIMRAAFDNAWIIKTDAYGFRYDQANDKILLSTDRKITNALAGYNNDDDYDLFTEEGNYISKLAKFFWNTQFYSAAIVALDDTGAMANIPWSNSACDLTTNTSYSSITQTQVQAIITTERNYTGDLSMPDLWDCSDFDSRPDATLIVTWQPSALFSYAPRAAVYPHECERKIFNLSDLEYASMLSLAFSEQYRTALSEYADKLSKIIDSTL